MVELCMYCGTPIRGSIWVCKCCYRVFEGHKQEIQCPICKGPVIAAVFESEAVTNPTCSECINAMRAGEEIVKDGGVYWQCRECGAFGVVHKDSQVAAAARELLQTPAPKMCVVSLSSCVMCNKGGK